VADNALWESLLARSTAELGAAAELLRELAFELDVLGSSIPAGGVGALRRHAAAVQTVAARAGWASLGVRAVSERLALLEDIALRRGEE